MNTYYGWGFGYELIRSEPLECTLNFATVAEIKELIDDLRLPIKKSGRKADLVSSVTDFLRNNPRYVIDKMTARDIITLKRLLAGESVLGDARVLSEFYLLARLGWIVLKEIKGRRGVVEMILLEEVEILFRPFMEELTLTLPRRIEQFVLGWSALCGYLPVPSISSYISRLPGFEGVTYEEVLDSLDSLSRSGTVTFIDIFNSGKGALVYRSPWEYVVGNPGTLIYRQEVHDGNPVRVNVYDPVEFSYDEIMYASLPLFFPHTPNRKEIERLAKLCRDNGLDEVATAELILDAWKEKQSEKEYPDMGILLMKFRFESFSRLNEIAAAITDYMNTIPYWRFLGKSSKEQAAREIASMKKAPRLTAGPNMKAMGMDIPEGMQEQVDRMWNQSFSGMADSKIVGRNDPCPCGSGKKYKKCCGK